MLGRPISLAVCCALGASAFLVPSTTAFQDDEAPSIFPLFEVDPKSQVLELPCSSCAWPYQDAVNELAEDTVDEDTFWAQGGANNLLLNFTISDDGHGLLLNDHYIYPFEKLAGNKNMMDDMYVDQVPASTTKQQIHDQEYKGAALKITGSSLSEQATVQADDDNALISLDWQLLSLEHQTMTVDSIFIQLLRTDNGELLILSIDTQPSTNDNIFSLPDESFALPPLHPDPATKPHGRPCTLPGPFCAISDFVSSTFGSSHRRPCPGRKFDGEHLPTHIRPHFGRPHFEELDWIEPSLDRPESKPFDHPPHHGHRHGHHHGHHRHGFFHAVSRTILAVLLPIMAGITVGIIVSVTGLLFGRLLGYLWFTFFRGGRRGYASVALEDDHVSEHKEDTVTEDDEALPVYEHAPPYENGVENRTT